MSNQVGAGVHVEGLDPRYLYRSMPLVNLLLSHGIMRSKTDVAALDLNFSRFITIKLGECRGKTSVFNEVLRLWRGVCVRVSVNHIA